MTALLMVFAIQRLPGETRIHVEKPKIILSADPKIEDRVDQSWAESFQDAALKKMDREPLVRVIDTSKTTAVLPEPVTVEKRRDTSPAKMPPVVQVFEEERPAARRRHQEVNTCTRHNMRKVSTHGGRSWRCRR